MDKGKSTARSLSGKSGGAITRVAKDFGLNAAMWGRWWSYSWKWCLT